jgi:hypothetical protein
MLACIEAGWRIHEVADELGLKPSAAQMRIQTARDRGVTTDGLGVPAAPRRPPTRAEQLVAPVEEREWLTATEAGDLVGVGKSTIARWRRLGLLQHTLYADQPRPLYLRADPTHRRSTSSQQRRHRPASSARADQLVAPRPVGPDR